MKIYLSYERDINGKKKYSRLPIIKVFEFMGYTYIKTKIKRGKNERVTN